MQFKCILSAVAISLLSTLTAQSMENPFPRRYSATYAAVGLMSEFTLESQDPNLAWLIGPKAAISFNQRLHLGGFYLFSPFGNERMLGGYTTDETYRLRYFGLTSSYHFTPAKQQHFMVGLLAGLGKVSTDGEISNIVNDLLIGTPSIGWEINLNNWAKAQLQVGYRIAVDWSNRRLKGINPSFSGPMLSLGLNFGSFIGY